jgi:hypothetical protein
VLRPIDAQSFYVCETLSPTLREENRLGVFENRVLRISVPKREEVTELKKTAY